MVKGKGVMHTYWVCDGSPEAQVPQPAESLVLVLFVVFAPCVLCVLRVVCVVFFSCILWQVSYVLYISYASLWQVSHVLCVSYASYGEELMHTYEGVMHTYCVCDGRPQAHTLLFMCSVCVVRLVCVLCVVCMLYVVCILCILCV
jgi:hypothetical protein